MPKPVLTTSPADLTRAIRNDLKQATASFLSAGEKLAVALQNEIWKPLGLHSWSEYCENQIGLSDAYCYDLIRMSELREQFPAIAPQMLQAGISKMRLVLGAVGQDRATRKFSATQPTLEGMLETAQREPYKQLAQTLRDAERGGNGEVLPPNARFTCPHCQTEFEVSRATTVLGIYSKRI